MTTQRITISLPERSVHRLENLKARTEAPSLTEVIKNALMTYESLVDHLSKGAVFFMSMPNGEQIGVEFLIDIKREKPDLRVVSSNAQPSEQD